MKKFFILGIIIVVCVSAIVFGYNSTQTQMSFIGPEEDMVEIIAIDTPDSYTQSETLELTTTVKNIHPDAVIVYYYRVLDGDFVGPVHPDTGWKMGFGLFVGMEHTKTISFNVPGYSGIGNDFHGVLEIGHKILGDYNFFIDDRMGFTVEYEDSTDPDYNHPPVLGVISGPNSAEVEEPVNFYVNAYDDDGDAIYVRWDLGEGTVTNWESVGDTASIVYNYGSAGTYNVKAQPKDSEDIGSWTTEKTIKITQDGDDDNLIDITFEIKDGDNKNHLESAVIVINSESKNTNQHGKTVFSLDSGTYQVEVNKEGYKKYEGIHTFTSDTTVSIELLPEGNNLPGFGFFSFVFGLIVMMIILNKKRKKKEMEL